MSLNAWLILAALAAAVAILVVLACKQRRGRAAMGADGNQMWFAGDGGSGDLGGSGASDGGDGGCDAGGDAGCDGGGGGGE